MATLKKIKLEILGLSSSQTQAGSFALVLGETEGNRRLPIIIGMFEAQAIAIEIEKIVPNRPMTHDLFKSFANNFHFHIDEIIISDLKEGMELEGTVSNVAQFGAFVDLGVHQDGLVHVSQLSNRFVNDAREVVKTGDIVKVRVLEVDVARKRISLTMKLDAPARSGEGRGAGQGNRFEPASRGQQRRPDATAGGTAMASAFAKLKGMGR